MSETKTFLSTEDQLILWDAVNRYAEARRADMARVGVEIQNAVVTVNNAVERILIRARHGPAAEADLQARLASATAERDEAARHAKRAEAVAAADYQRVVAEAAAMRSALEGYHKVAASIPYAQWTPEIHHAESALSSSAGSALLAELADLRARAEKAEKERDALRERRFPIMGGPSIPWAMIAPHEAQARKNHYQGLERLAERHGLDPWEALAVLSDCNWRDVGATTPAEGRARLEVLLAEWDARHAASVRRAVEEERARCLAEVNAAKQTEAVCRDRKADARQFTSAERHDWAVDVCEGIESAIRARGKE